MDGAAALFDPSALIRSRIKEPVPPVAAHRIVAWTDVLLLLLFFVVCVALLKSGVLR